MEQSAWGIWMSCSYGGAVLLFAVWCVHVSRAIKRTLTVIVQCICQQQRTILYGDIKRCQLCEIQFAWSPNPTWHNRRGMHISLKRPRLKSCHAVFDEKIAPVPVSGQSLDRGAALWMHVVRSRVTKNFGGNEFMDSIALFCKTSHRKKNSRNRKM